MVLTSVLRPVLEKGQRHLFLAHLHRQVEVAHVHRRLVHAARRRAARRAGARRQTWSGWRRVPALDKMSMFHLPVTVQDDLGHGHRQRRRRRGLGRHHLRRHERAPDKVRVLGRRRLPVLGHVRVRVSCHGAEHRLLAGHGREHGVMSCVRVWAVLVELNLGSGRGIWSFHLDGLFFARALSGTGGRRLERISPAGGSRAVAEWYKLVQRKWCPMNGRWCPLGSLVCYLHIDTEGLRRRMLVTVKRVSVPGTCVGREGLWYRRDDVGTGW